MALRLAGTALIVGLLLLGGMLQIRTVSAATKDDSAAAPAMPRFGPLQSTNTSIITTTTICIKTNNGCFGQPSLTCAGLNLEQCGVWQDTATGNTFNVTQFVGNGYFELTATYLTDSQCNSSTLSGAPYYIKADFNGSFATIGNNAGGMYRCTAPSNTIVQNCSQPAVWMTNFNATVHVNAGTGQISIVGQYVDQYWTWNTENGTITDCSIEYTFPNDFTLVPVSSTNSSSSSTSGTSISSSQSSSGGQGGGASNPSQVSGGSATTSRSTTSSSSASTRQSSSGHLGIEILAAGAIFAVIAVAAVSVGFLRKKPV